MKSGLSRFQKVYIPLIIFYLFSCQELWARAGGGGGGHGGGGGSDGGGDYGLSSLIVNLLFSNTSASTKIIIFIVVFAIYIIYKKQKQAASNSNEPIVQPSLPYPEGLSPEKVQTSFLSIQDAWQKKDLKDVRKWISDGVYQRYTAQFGMMNKLSQVNRLSNIRINDISVAKTALDGNYQTADVAVSFTMNDEFISDKYPSFNESFTDDSDTEYWTFIKRKDARNDKNLYNDNSCPNCGAPFETKMGEISRCEHCGTLTNNATYDWVLSEIIQADDYSDESEFAKTKELEELTKNDKLFSIGRMEDIASNAFMQVMQVLAGENERKLTRFADKGVIADVIMDRTNAQYVFDRLYLNDVCLTDFETSDGRLDLIFTLTSTWQRVQAGAQLALVDTEPVVNKFKMVLSKNIKALQTPSNEIVFSYECPNCGAPFTDTTEDVCSYCNETIVNLDRNWVLTSLEMEGEEEQDNELAMNDKQSEGSLHN